MNRKCASYFSKGGCGQQRSMNWRNRLGGFELVILTSIFVWRPPTGSIDKCAEIEHCSSCFLSITGARLEEKRVDVLSSNQHQSSTHLHQRWIMVIKTIEYLLLGGEIAITRILQNCIGWQFKEAFKFMSSKRKPQVVDRWTGVVTSNTGSYLRKFSDFQLLPFARTVCWDRTKLRIMFTTF